MAKRLKWTLLLLAFVLLIALVLHPGWKPRLILPTGTGRAKVALGDSHGVILASDGSLWVWGEEDSGWPALGLGTVQRQPSLRRLGTNTDWVDVAAGVSHTLALKADGTIWAWGENFGWQLGDGTRTQRSTPIRSVTGNDWNQVAPEQLAAIQSLFDEPWLGQNLEQRALGFAIQKIVPGHLEEIRTRREAYIQKVMQQVKARLTSEINYWDHRSNVLKAQEDAGKSRSNLNSANARRNADDLADRLKKRMAELEQEKAIVARPPNVLGGALVVPASWFATAGETNALRETPPNYGAPDREVERLAMEKVMQFEREQGFEPRDISAENRGYDIESRDPKTERLHFIEVKGRVKGATTVTVTKNEILTSLNRPEAFVLAIVFVASGAAETPIYLRQPFSQEPEFGTASVNFKLSELLEKATAQKV